MKNQTRMKIRKEEPKLMIHTISTTKESVVQEYLEKCYSEDKKTFVLSKRDTCDGGRIRYDVFIFETEDE